MYALKSSNMPPGGPASDSNDEDEEELEDKSDRADELRRGRLREADEGGLGTDEPDAAFAGS